MQMNQNVFPQDLFNQQLSYREAQSISTRMTVRIDEDIREVQYYSNVIERINELTENDELHVVINTGGGSLQSTLAIINAINNCQAEVTGIIEGEASSGGSAIALSCPSLAVSPYATLFIHAASGITGGKMPDHAAMFSFNHKWQSEVLSDIYRGFLTDKELEEMFNGKDFYFDADGIIERLEQRAKYYENKAKEAEKAEKKQQLENAKRSQVEVSKPKRKSQKALLDEMMEELTT